MEKSHGFTLIELVVSVTVLAIVVTMAAPSFNAMIQGNRATASANQLATAMQMARSEALKRAGPVAVCASEDQATCSGDWADGWIVLDVDSGDLIQAWSDPVRRGGLTVNGTLTGNTVQFLPAGNSNLANPVSFELRFEGCTRDGNRDIRLTPSGRVGVTREACS